MTIAKISLHCILNWLLVINSLVKHTKKFEEDTTGRAKWISKKRGHGTLKNIVGN